MKTHSIVPAPSRREGLGSTRRLLRPGLTALFFASVACLAAFAVARAAQAEPLAVCASTPDLGSLVREIGGDHVAVTVFVKGTEDPHFAEAKPSFVKLLNQADLYVQNGFDMETGYAPVLLQQARNPKVMPGAPGFLDTSSAAGRALDMPSGPVDRSMGDVHPYGNPHYLLDPLRGLEAARLIAAKLDELRPGEASYFDGRLKDFEGRLFAELVGPPLAAKYGSDVPKLALLFQSGKLDAFLTERGQRAELGGWLASMLPHVGAKTVDDHPIWTYFASTFGLVVVAHLEPLPGVPPTTRHLEDVISEMRTDGVKIVLASAYYDPRYAKLVGESTGATVLHMANQVEAVPAASTYLAMISYNVAQVAGALGGGH